jgi:2-polyprenyl-3-methyl-5-hydroxy-6-metoxy-1,4-benzoquinol methylase/glycosyltransferase involved in cell wall biosynthesis
MNDITAAPLPAPPASDAGPPVSGLHVYPDYANPDILDKIPLSARVVLDVGCAKGALGAAYLRRNPNARMLGVDIDPASIAAAQGRLTEVACTDVETDALPFAVPEGIDCIIYGDVLEHLRDPWALLKRHALLLNEGGTMLVCMPNIEHWTMTLMLLNGGFDYADDGIMDRTHLRWFTPRTMGAALANAGLTLSDVAPRVFNPDGVQKFTAAITPALRAINVDPADYLNRAGPLQFVWRARKNPPPRIVLNATMLAPLGGVSDVRVVEPLRALRTDSAVIGVIASEPDLQPILPDYAKIVILHRPLLIGEGGLDRVKALIAKGYLIVSEFDDHPVFMASRGVQMDQVLTFRAVHAVQTSTPALAEVLGAENPEIGMFPNGIFELPEIRNFRNPDQLTLFFGALNRGEDWAPLMPALNEVARAVGARLKFSVVHDQGFFDALESPHKSFTPTCDYPAYLNLLGEADIAFMPLEDNVFNRAKSDLKFIEASACRVVSLASSVVYANSIEDGKTGLIFRNPVEMRAHLLRLLAYPEASRKIADAARNYVAQKRMLAYQAADRLAWYRSLWERRDALNEALKARVPALFQ